jgi:small GTP-binding protein
MDLTMDEAVRDLLNRERLAIADLRTVLGKLDAASGDLAELKSALRDLEGLFMLVVVGEYNAGKSTVLNALLGQAVMLEGVTPTTDRITILTYGEQAKETDEGGFLLRREAPLPLLREVAFVDTPGTNAVIKRHQELTERFVPRADLVLFVTSADRPFTESERAFLELIASWGKKIVIIVNKLDILESEADRRQVLEFVTVHAREALGLTPRVFGVSAKQAFRAKQAGDEAGIEASGLRGLERFIAETLQGDERLKLKLLNPLGVAQHVGTVYEQVVRERLALLEGDRRTLEEVDRQLVQFGRDMRREFESYLARVKTALLEVERRGEVFFDDTVRLRKLLVLLDGQRVREAFTAQVIRGADRDIDRAVTEMVDWFVQRNLQLWEDVMAYLAERRQAAEERVIGEVGGRFQYDRQALLNAFNQSAKEVMASYNEEQEGRRLADSLQGAGVQTGLLQAGGLGLGAAVLAFLSGTAFDVTGIAAGLTIAGLGLLVLPRRRRQAKRELHQKMQALRDGLAESLSGQIDAELRRAHEKLTGAILPYTRFVRSELGRLEAAEEELLACQAALRDLKREIEALA